MSGQDMGPWQTWEFLRAVSVAGFSAAVVGAIFHYGFIGGCTFAAVIWTFNEMRS
jgi:hypothetical protein